MSEIDIHVLPPQPYPGSIARDISTTVTEHEIVDFPGFQLQTDGPVWVSFMADVDWYPLFQKDESTPIPDPDPTARGTSDQQCWRVPANFELQRKIDVTSNKLKVVAEEDGVLRWHIASYQG